MPTSSSLRVAHTERDVFAELHGFFVADPVLLDELHERQSRDLDLLQLYSETEAGDRAARAGVVIPILGLDADYHSVAFRTEEESSLLPAPPRASSSGWILHVASQEILLGGLGYLKKWDPRHPKLRRIRLPTGWYAVTISLAARALDEQAIEVVLRPSTSAPPFSADLGATFADVARA